MAKAYDIIYRYIHEKKLDYFEIADLEDTFETRYKSEIVKADSKEQALDNFHARHTGYTDIISVRELFSTKNYDGGRELQ